MGKVAQGTAFTFVSASTDGLRSISIEQSGTEIDVSDLADLTKKYALGQTDISISLGFVGEASTGWTVGTSGTATLTFPGGSAESLGSVFVSARNRGAENDAEITTELTLRPTDS